MKFTPDFSFTSAPHRPRAGWHPGHLFRTGEAGAWYDPADLSMLFQDAAGITPVSAAGQAVGLMRDKSGNAKHASQATTAAKPILRRHPATGARNLHPYSQSGDGYTTAGTTPPAIVQNTIHLGETCVAITVGAANATSYSGTRVDRNAAPATLVPILSGQSYKGSYHLSLSRVLTGSESLGVYFTGASGLGLFLLNAANAPAFFGQFQRAVGATSTASANGNVRLTIYVHSALQSDVTLYLNRAQIEQGAAATGYQTVLSPYDVTEVGVPDLWSLAFDGVDDYLVTPAIDFSGTDEMSLFAGLRKPSDAARGFVMELGVSSANPGTFSMRAPSGPGAADYAISSTGSLLATAFSGAVAAAPDTSVVSALIAISGDSLALRTNGIERAVVVADQGAGNFGNHPLYIGRRAGASEPFNGNLYQLIARGAVSNTDQIARVEQYLAAKAGVTL